jgi:hypothetical protein
MTIKNALQRRRVKWLLWFGFWTLIGLSFAFQFYISSAKAGLEVTWRQAVGYALGDWYVFAVLSIPVVWLARRFDFESGHRRRSLAVHLPASLAFSLAYMVLRAGVGRLQSEASFAEAFLPLLVKTWHFNLLIYWVIVAVTFAFDYYRKYRERELRAVELEKRLAEAKLQTLQMQLNPHFLFNSLHSISALVHQDAEAADRMIVRLRDTLDARVPNLILQPLVENAIRHGIEPRAKPGCIELRSQYENSTLTLEVCDNGAGLRKDGPAEEGVGLSNTRARLQALYGEAHGFELRDAPGGGLLVRLIIPFRQENSPA